MFNNDQIIDKVLLDLVKKIKILTKENPTITFLKDKNSWIVTVPESWCTKTSIAYYQMDLEPFRIWKKQDIIEDGYPEFRDTIMLDTRVSTIESIIRMLKLVRLSDNGIPTEVIRYIQENLALGISYEDSIKSIGTKTDIVLNAKQIDFLGIQNQTGAIIGRKFGL